MRRIGFAALALLLVVTVSEGRCDVITGVSIYDFSSEFPVFGRVANNTVNGSGLVGDLHEATDGPGMWHTEFEDFVPSENNALALAIARAWKWQEELESGKYPSVEELASAKKNRRQLRASNVPPQFVGSRYRRGDSAERRT